MMYRKILKITLRRIRFLLPLLPIWFEEVLASKAEYTCTGNYTLHRNSCYLFALESKKVYWKASIHCRETGGELVTIRDEYTQEFLTSYGRELIKQREENFLSSGGEPSSSVADRYTFWIGLSDRVGKHEFRWNRCGDGVFRPIDYQAWEEDIEGTQMWKWRDRCVALDLDSRSAVAIGRWTVLSCSSSSYFICQTEADVTYISEPTQTITKFTYSAAVVNPQTQPSAVGTFYTPLQELRTQRATVTSAYSPLRAILIVLVIVIIISIILAIWYRKRNRDSQQRRLILASGMPGMGFRPAPAPQPMMFRRQFAPEGRHFSNNNSNRILIERPEPVIDMSNRVVYSGINIDVIEQDDPVAASVAESTLSFHSENLHSSPKMARFGSNAMTPVE